MYKLSIHQPLYRLLSTRFFSKLLNHMSKSYLPIIFFYGGTHATKIYKLNYFYSNYLITDEMTVLNLFVTLTTLGKILFYLVCFVLSKLKKTTCCLAKPENVLCDRKKKKMSLLSLDGNYIYHNTLLYILLQSSSPMFWTVSQVLVCLWLLQIHPTAVQSEGLPMWGPSGNLKFSMLAILKMENSGGVIVTRAFYTNLMQTTHQTRTINTTITTNT